MLRSELRDSDIPSRSTLKRRVEQVFEQYLKQLENDMSVSQCLPLLYLKCI